MRLAQALNRPLTSAIGKIVLGEVIRHPHLAHIINEIEPGRALNVLATCLALQMELGRLRRVDPHIAARLLVGPFVSYFVSRDVLDQPEARAIAAQSIAAEAIAHFLRSMQPDQ